MKSLTALGGIAYWQSEFGSSDAAYVEALEIVRELGDEAGMVEALFNVASTKAVTGDHEMAPALLMESLQRARDLGDRRGEGWALWGLGVGSMFAGDLDRAVELIDEALRVFEELGDDKWGLGNALVIASQLLFLAISEIQLGHVERAVRLAAVGTELREKVGGKIPDAFFPFEDPRDSAAKILDPETLERLWAEGRAMSIDEALAYAREG